MQYYTSATTLGAPSKPVEIKLDLWSADGTTAASAGTTAGANNSFLCDGSSFPSGVTMTYTPAQLHTLSTKWSSGTKFALEVTLYSTGGTNTSYATLWDMTSNAQVTASQISTTSSTATVVRSAQFTLTSGHIFGLSAWSASNNANIADASLIIFP